MEKLKIYVKENSAFLFKQYEKNESIAIFDNKGFFLSDHAQELFDVVKNAPHLYVAWTDSQNGYYYIGKSYQQNGRWKRQHAYHLGTLAYHLLDTIRYDDQNHQHWIDKWMDQNSKQFHDPNFLTIRLRFKIKIAFIPFEIYTGIHYETMSKDNIRAINSKFERDLIKSYRDEGVELLNVRHNSTS